MGDFAVVNSIYSEYFNEEKRKELLVHLLNNKFIQIDKNHLQSGGSCGIIIDKVICQKIPTLRPFCRNKNDGKPHGGSVKVTRVKKTNITSFTRKIP